MSGFPILDLVVGIIFVYFLLSIICSSLIEMIQIGLNVRSKLLREWLFTLFSENVKDKEGKDVALAQAILDHYSVSVLKNNGKTVPYIDAKNFAGALLEKVTHGVDDIKSVAKNIDEIIASVEKSTVLPQEFQRMLLMYANEVKDTFGALPSDEKTAGQMSMFKNKIENWFDSSMERVTGALKLRYTRKITLCVAIVVTVMLNADSIALAKYLYSNPEVRTKLAAQAYDATRDSLLINRAISKPVPDSLIKNLKPAQLDSIMKVRITEMRSAKQALSDVMPLTWKGGEITGADGKTSLLLILSKFAGLFASVLAIMMGAPFWFDMLNKLSNLRGTGARPAVATDDDKKKK
jgi:hypothetical protein